MAHPRCCVGGTTTSCIVSSGAHPPLLATERLPDTAHTHNSPKSAILARRGQQCAVGAVGGVIDAGRVAKELQREPATVQGYKIAA